MPRNVRVDIEGRLYHVYNRVGQGQRPFADEVEAVVFLDLLREVNKRVAERAFEKQVDELDSRIARRES